MRPSSMYPSYQTTGTLEKFHSQTKLRAAENAPNSRHENHPDAKKSERKKDVEEENREDFVYPTTPSGEKKRFSCLLPKQHNPSAVEKS